MKFSSILPLLSAFPLLAVAQSIDQTSTYSPVLTTGLPYTISLKSVDLGGANLPTLQSYAYGTYDGEWVFVDGRTSGLHLFTADGKVNFPPKEQNTSIWVVDPLTKQTWNRSLTNSDLSASQVSALSATAPEFAQNGNKLYVAGGYLYDSASNNFTTYPTLTALDLAGVVDWVKNATSALSTSVQQTTNSAVQVTGGSMNFVNGNNVLLTFGQDFEGPYTAGANGTYTEQIRSFSIVDGVGGLGITNISASTPQDAFRRRDLNVVPIAGTGPGGPALVALSGVFTTNGGAWTVPVEISTNGTPVMADPSSSNTFKQSMNNYKCPRISLYSPSRNENDIVLAGGISMFTYQSGAFVYDVNEGFTSQGTVVVRDSSGSYSQYYLGNLYPDIINPSTGNPLLFGAGAEFLMNPNLPMTNGLINLDGLHDGDSLGYIFGGIAAEQPDFGKTTASDQLFQVFYNTVPEPSTYALFGLGAIGILMVMRRKKAA